MFINKEAALVALLALCSLPSEARTFEQLLYAAERKVSECRGIRTFSPDAAPEQCTKLTRQETLAYTAQQYMAYGSDGELLVFFVSSTAGQMNMIIEMLAEISEDESAQLLRAGMEIACPEPPTAVVYPLFRAVYPLPQESFDALDEMLAGFVVELRIVGPRIRAYVESQEHN